MRVPAALFGILTTALTGACGYSVGPSYQSPVSVSATNASEIIRPNWTEYQSISTGQGGHIYLSPDRSIIGLPTHVTVPTGVKDEAKDCKFTVIGSFTVTPTAENESAFQLKNAHVVFDDIQKTYPQNDPLCASLTKDDIIKRALRSEYDKKSELRTDRVIRFEEDVIVFGSREQQPVPWGDNVFVKAESRADATADFFAWFDGTYSEEFGSLKVQKAAKLIEADIRARRDIAPELFQSGLYKKSEICDLKFKAPVTRVTYEAWRTGGYGGMFIWLSTKELLPSQIACIQNRFRSGNVRSAINEVGLSIDIPSKSRLRMSLADFYWLGERKADTFK